jgi:glutamate synthase domain-containing protein 3
MDAHGDLALRVNSDFVMIDPLGSDDEELFVRLVELHRDATDSQCSARLLEHWETTRPKLRAVWPREQAGRRDAIRSDLRRSLTRESGPQSAPSHTSQSCEPP